MRIFCIKKRLLYVILLGLVAVTSIISFSTFAASAAPKPTYTIVLDAGHGGVDCGAVGVNTKITEAEINLSVVKKLENWLTNFGFRVVLTRHDAGGLYSMSASNKKQDDLKKRKTIIEKANANIMVSVHMNSYIDSSEKGAQTFYLLKDEGGKLLADSIQTELKSKLPNARQSNLADLYMLKCANIPSVVVEGGFLSNPEDEALLVTSEYQSQLAYSIFCGIVRFYEKSFKQEIA